MSEFVLVSCSKSKLEGVCRGENKYEASSVFRKRRKLAHDADAWGILSAKYGFVEPWKPLPDYDMNIRQRSAVWGAFVLDDLLPALEYHNPDIVRIYAGSGYIDPLVAELEARGYDVIDPHRGLRPGERESRLKEKLQSGRQQRLATDDGNIRNSE